MDETCVTGEGTIGFVIIDQRNGIDKVLPGPDKSVPDLFYDQQDAVDYCQELQREFNTDALLVYEVIGARPQ